MRTRHVLLAVVVCASVVPAGEYRVNVRTTASQANPALALGDAGDVLAVWSSYYGSSGRSNEICARCWGLSDVRPASAEFQVNVAREGNHSEPAVACDGRGNFVVVWQGPGPEAEDIFVRRFDPNGAALTGEMLVHSYTPGRQLYPRVAAEDAGAFVVVWESRGPADESQRSVVCARCFDPNAARGEAFVVDQDAYDCRYPDIAMDAAGGFAVAWMQDRTRKTVFARVFDPNGRAAAAAFEVSRVGCSSLTRPSVAMNGAGRFVVTWDGDPNRAGDDDVHARLYDPDGTPRTDQFRVNTLTDGAQQWPRAAVNDANELVIVWVHDANESGRATDIHARRFDWDGVPAAEPFLLHTLAAGKQQYPAAALADDGTLVALWETEDPNGGGYDIRACTVPAPTDPDFDGDGRVTFFDFAALARHWRQPAQGPPADLTGDGTIDTDDLMALCRRWLRQ